MYFPTFKVQNLISGFSKDFKKWHTLNKKLEQVRFEFEKVIIKINLCHVPYFTGKEWKMLA